LEGVNLARLAYVGLDGRPRVVPIWVAHRSGQNGHAEIVMITGP